MFIVDNILLSPMKGFMWIVRELHNAAQQEIQSEGEQLTHRLSTLYMMLETGQITSEEFDVQEGEILSRLDEIELAKGAGADEGEGDDEDGDEDLEEDDQDDAEEEEGGEVEARHAAEEQPEAEAAAEDGAEGLVVDDGAADEPPDRGGWDERFG